LDWPSNKASIVISSKLRGGHRKNLVETRELADLAIDLGLALAAKSSLLPLSPDRKS
jgi:hypothetical protein